MMALSNGIAKSNSHRKCEIKMDFGETSHESEKK